MYQIIPLIVVFVLITISVNTQTFAGQQDDNVSLYLQQVKNNFLQQLSPGSVLPEDDSNILNQWVESSEIRLTADDDEKRNRSIALNLKIRNFSELDIQQQMFQLLEKRQYLDVNKQLNNHLRLAYLQLLDLNLKLELLEHLKKQSRFSATEIKFQRELVQSTNFKPENLLDSELDHEQIQFQIETQQSSILKLQKSMDFSAQQAFLNLAAEQMIDFAEIHSLQNSNAVQQSQLELQLAKLKLKQQQASEGFALNSFQLKSDFSDNQDNVLTVRFDVQIPFAGPNFSHRLKQQEITRASLQLQQRQQQFALQATQILEEMEQSSSTLKATKKMAGQIKFRLLKTSNVRLILKLKKQHFSRLRKIIEIRHNIRLNYIDLLAKSGLLAEQANKNWLSTK